MYKIKGYSEGVPNVSMQIDTRRPLVRRRAAAGERQWLRKLDQQRLKCRQSRINTGELRNTSMWMAELVRAAQYRGVTTYQDVAVIMGLPQKGSHMGAETGHVLGEISEDEFRSGRPMLSAVSVGVNGKPGSGFYTLARDLGLLKSDQDEFEFWQAQREAVYQAWRRPLPEE